MVSNSLKTEDPSPDDPHIEWAGPGEGGTRHAHGPEARMWVHRPGEGTPEDARSDRRTVSRGARHSMHITGGARLVGYFRNVPKGAHLAMAGEAVFKHVEVNRQTQMEHARQGPVA
jgi:hypothetical protein